ncbi:glycosyl transferase, WecB/TagA/CpsF family [Shewanella sediminis HAW-EB3]|uniref:Glycosyl transferase, WecB/TagA/CpsF family n=1 Tax=Shewanella sediminis (strain HAW-EB3) TaxID=425104 RepID=A8FXI5_SHESH|nr:WecB/TagA/CpsF family glycosyltransferase [Shewanella sediminis]ABV37558.1 glycosyl transferase, WecB/TagA/CpsF family [Shewanella sediminis HAW-EB3]
MTTQTHITQTGIKPFSVRAIDILVAVLLIAVASPILILKYIYRRCRYGSAIEYVYIYGLDNTQITLYQFTGEGICCQWPHLLNLLKGDISLLGTEQSYIFEEASAHNPASSLTHKLSTNQLSNLTEIKPGLLSFKLMHQQVGLSFENQDNAIINAHRSALSYLLAISRTLVIWLFSSHDANKHTKTIPLFDIELNNLSMSELLTRITSQARQSRALPMYKQAVDKQAMNKPAMAQYAFVNADCMNISIKNSQYRHCLQNACDMVFADGSGIRLASLWKGLAPKDNLNGTDMFPLLCQQLADNGLSLFLLGGEEGIAASAADKMQCRFPRLKVAGTHHGFIDDPKLNDAVIKQINESGASVLLVAMGAPKQELWLAKHKHRLDVAVGIGVGGLFDFYAEKVKRAPLWVRQIGMEWICRLSEEPGRMWKRYILGNPLFIYRVLKEIRRERAQAVMTQKSIRKDSHKLNQSHSGNGAMIEPECKTDTTASDISIADLSNIETKNLLALTRCQRQRISRRLGCGVKRILDLFGASFLLLLLLPALMLVALLIRIESKGPVLFSQQRAGKNNTPFTMWKFRSMYQDAEQRLGKLQADNEMQGGVLFKMKRDPRITLVGKFIRKASIDELPQLWNVICGEMSLVGPRPALESEVKQYSLKERKRLAVKPGITCIWQVSGRSDIPFDRQVELDVDYIYQQSLLTDIWILLKTIPAVLLARGAY